MFSLNVALVIGTIATAAAFAPAANSRTHGFSYVAKFPPSASKRGMLRRRETAFHPRTGPLFQSQLLDNIDNNNDVFLLSIDGTLASTNRSRSWMAVCVALRIWPSLHSNMESLGIDHTAFDLECINDVKEDETYNWLLQKMAALSSITQQGNSPDAMLGCNAVLLARLLLEEQMLDAGRSNGRGGKYGGKFHPSSTDWDESMGERSKVGSRPLTVGEIYANWQELVEVTRMKYPFIAQSPDGKLKRSDPLPQIQQQLEEMFFTTHQSSIMQSLLPTWRSLSHDILFDYSNMSSESNNKCANLRQNTMLLLGHDSQLSWALMTLSMLGYALDIESDLEIPPFSANIEVESTGLKMKVQVTTSDKAQEQLMLQKTKEGEEKSSLVLVVPNAQKGETHSDMIEQIVTDINGSSDAQLDRNVFVVHSSLEVLKKCKSFLGDDVPRLSQGLRKCSLPGSNTAVTLFLPGWADNIHPTEQNDGEMDPWLNFVSEEQFLELISARIAAPLS